MKESCNLIFCGDICPTPDTEKYFVRGDAKGLFNDLLGTFGQADLLVANLECPLIDQGKPILKCGPALKGRLKDIELLKTAGFSVAGLANNHIRDYGDEGVLSTIDACRRVGLLTVGAGPNATEAAKPLILNVSGWKIGILAFAEQEFNAASAEGAGANLFDACESFDSIRQLRGQCDYLAVLYHGGVEYYVYPSPLLQKKCRKMAQAGADLVLCQHSHCVGSVEKHGGSTILYGQGNTVYGYRRNAPSWNEGLLVKVSLSSREGRNAVLQYLPIETDGSGIKSMPSDREKKNLKVFKERSGKLDEKYFVETSWESFCEAQQSYYFPLLFGLGRALNYANRKLKNKIIKFLFSKARMRIAMNLIRCEAHREVLQTILEHTCEDRRPGKVS